MQHRICKINRLAIIFASASCVGFNTYSFAQIAETKLPEILTDSNGVELTTGKLRIELPLVSFGDGVQPRISLFGKYPITEDSFYHAQNCCNLKSLVFNSVDPIQRHEYFYIDGSEVQSAPTPSGTAIWKNYSLEEISTGNGYYYKRPAGGVFNTLYFNGPRTNPSRQLLGIVDNNGNVLKTGTSSAQYYRSNGEVWNILYQTSSFPSSPTVGVSFRIRHISTNRGFFVQYQYERETAPTSSAHLPSWKTVTKITGASLAHVYCDTNSSNLCAGADNEGNFVHFDYSDGVQISHASGAVTKYRISSSGNLEITSPSTNVAVIATKTASTQCNDEYVNQISSLGSTWVYDYQCVEGEQGNDWNLTRSDPLGRTLIATGVTRDSVPELMQDENLNLYFWDADRIFGYTGFDYPEGGRSYILRDDRNNVTEHGRYAKNNIDKIVTYKASYPALCSNFQTCNKPVWVKDGNGNQTDFSYDSQHGGVLSETGPADANGVRPQKRYEYAQRFAWLKNSAGGYSQAPTPIWVVTKEEHCINTAAVGTGCAGGAADELVTTFEYGPDSGPNNLLLRGIAVTANGETLRTCYGYDRMGRKISETQPAADLTACP